MGVQGVTGAQGQGAVVLKGIAVRADPPRGAGTCHALEGEAGRNPGPQDDIGAGSVGVGGVGEGDGVADLDLVGAGGIGLDQEIRGMSLHLNHRPVVDVVAGEGLVAGGQCGLDPVASHDAGQVHLAGDVLALGDLRRSAGDAETLSRSGGRDDLASEGGQVAGQGAHLCLPLGPAGGDGEVRQRGGGVVPRRHGEAGGVLGGAVDPDVLGGHGGVSLAGSGLVRRDGGLKNRVARGDLDGRGETVAARVRTGSRHRGPQIQVEVAALVPLEVEVDLIGQLQVLRSAGNGFDRADGLTQQGVVQLRDGAQLGVHDQGRGLTVAIVDVEGARPGHLVTVLGGAGPGPLARHGVGLNGDVRGALRGDG